MGLLYKVPAACGAEVHLTLPRTAAVDHVMASWVRLLLTPNKLQHPLRGWTEDKQETLQFSLTKRSTTNWTTPTRTQRGGRRLCGNRTGTSFCSLSTERTASQPKPSNGHLRLSNPAPSFWTDACILFLFLILPTTGMGRAPMTCRKSFQADPLGSLGQPRGAVC